LEVLPKKREEPKHKPVTTPRAGIQAAGVTTKKKKPYALTSCARVYGLILVCQVQQREQC
jgi:hypothetical protein